MKLWTRKCCQSATDSVDKAVDNPSKECSTGK